MLKLESFKTVVENAPLVSIDFIIYDNERNRILLGKRTNRPALGYYFTLGGRVFKNENILDAQKRIFRNEFDFELKKNVKFLGVFEHFYDDSFYGDVSTHYVNLAYEISISSLEVEMFRNLPKVQHSVYEWFYLDELLNSQKVHKYVKNYFNKIGEN